MMENFEVEACVGFKLTIKLKNIKARIKDWARQKFRIIYQAKLNILK